MPGGSGLGQLQVFVPPGASALPRFAWLTQQGVFQGALQPRPASPPRTPLDFLEDRSLLPFQDRTNQPRGIVRRTSLLKVFLLSPRHYRFLSDSRR